METIKFEQEIELERVGEDEHVLRFRMPQLKISPKPTDSHLKQAKGEVLLALRSLIDKTIKVEEEKGKE